jgi:hypothetical protein
MILPDLTMNRLIQDPRLAIWDHSLGTMRNIVHGRYGLKLLTLIASSIILN